MFKSRFSMGRRSALPRKVAGVVVAVAGIAVLVETLPLVVWWCLLGVGLLLTGWKLFTG